MAYKEVIYPAEKDGFYALLREQVELYTRDSPDLAPDVSDRRGA